MESGGWIGVALLVIGGCRSGDAGGPSLPGPDAARDATLDADGNAASDASIAGADARREASFLDVDAAPTTGNASEVHVLTYNVAGLPAGLSQSQPELYTPLISPLLNSYDLVLVQEDFGFHAQLAAQTVHPYQSEPQPVQDRFVADGLNRFSQTPFEPLERVTWVSCNGTLDAGSDCLASKGFSFARHVLADGRSIDVYNHHADAGRAQADAQARMEGFEQLADFILERSEGRAVIVAGDTNLRGFDALDEPVLEGLLTATGLADSCRSLGCDDEHVDRVLWRSGDDLELAPSEWRVADEFVTDAGEPLSDHVAIAVTLSVR